MGHRPFPHHAALFPADRHQANVIHEYRFYHSVTRAAMGKTMRGNTACVAQQNLPVNRPRKSDIFAVQATRLASLPSSILDLRSADILLFPDVHAYHFYNVREGIVASLRRHDKAWRTVLRKRMLNPGLTSLFSKEIDALICPFVSGCGQSDLPQLLQRAIRAKLHKNSNSVMFGAAVFPAGSPSSTMTTDLPSADLPTFTMRHQP